MSGAQVTVDANLVLRAAFSCGEALAGTIAALGREGAALVFHAIGPGEFFGDMAGSGSDRSGTQVEALGEGAALHFAASVMVRLMESYRSVALAIARRLSARIVTMRRRMVESALLSATGRIAAELAASRFQFAVQSVCESEVAVSVADERAKTHRLGLGRFGAHRCTPPVSGRLLQRAHECKDAIR